MPSAFEAAAPAVAPSPMAEVVHKLCYDKFDEPLTAVEAGLVGKTEAPPPPTSGRLASRCGRR